VSGVRVRAGVVIAAEQRQQPRRVPTMGEQCVDRRVSGIGLRMIALDDGTSANDPAERRKIMVVQDEFLLRMSTAADLRRRGHQVIEAFNADEARRALHADDEIALVVMDVKLGDELNGLDLARWIRAHRPAAKVLVTAAVAPDSDDITILAKPFRPLELFVLVEAMLASS
jgi:CheY-like chemotaxis protein